MQRKSRGSSIAETAASMVILLPLLIMILYVGLEASKAYMIKESLAQASRQASRNLAIAYGQDKSVANNQSLEDAYVYSNIRINGVVASSDQFRAEWNNTASPPTVKVTVDYTSGQNGLAPFPDPDPLGLGSSFHLSASSTYRLE